MLHHTHLYDLSEMLKTHTHTHSKQHPPAIAAFDAGAQGAQQQEVRGLAAGADERQGQWRGAAGDG
jgi:hypothetical protein